MPGGGMVTGRQPKVRESLQTTLANCLTTPRERGERLAGRSMAAAACTGDWLLIWTPRCPGPLVSLGFPRTC